MMQLSVGITCQSVSLVLFCLLVSCSACFVRNCPPGGKRSMDSFLHQHRECQRCGPDDIGQCVGPNICCGHSIGCFINTVEAEVCQKENEILTPCQIEGDICGRLGEGRCVAAGVCCNDEHCQLDDGCGHFTNSDLSAPFAQKRLTSRISPEVVKFLRKIFEHKSFQRRK